jgi:hypothetical protein
MLDSVPDASPVLIEIMHGDALGLGAAAKLIPATRGDSPNARPATVWRWINNGSRAIDGRIVKLEASRVGGRWLTSRAAIARFSTALTSSVPPSVSDGRTAERSAPARQRAAMKFLTAAGA